jgi:hypothetical protein
MSPQLMHRQAESFSAPDGVDVDIDEIISTIRPAQRKHVIVAPPGTE